jgi:hypothetical protein
MALKNDITISRGLGIILCIVIIMVGCQTDINVENTVSNIPLTSTSLVIPSLTPSNRAEYTISTEQSTSKPNTESVTSVPSFNPTKVTACSDDITQVTDQQVINFYWSNDSKKINYTTDPQKKVWYSYYPMGKIKEIFQHPLPTTTPLTLSLVSALISQHQENPYIYSMSSDGNSGLLAFNEPIVSSQDTTRNILYLIDLNTKTVKELGAVDGVISDILWSENGAIAVIAMDDLGKERPKVAFMWVVRKEQGSLLPLFRIDDRSMAPGIYNISIDGTYILYGENTKETVWMINTHDYSDIALSIPRSRWVWWYQGEREILYLQNSKDKPLSFDMMIYDVNTGEGRMVSKSKLTIDVWRTDSVQLSYDQKFIAYTSEESSFLMIRAICE